MGTTAIIWIIIAAIVAATAGYFIALSVSKKNARSASNLLIEDARREADVIKEKKILEAKEEEMKILSEAGLPISCLLSLKSL
ncbi:MAG: Rnase Y domain-containing protein [Muribaculaceae bacterium]|nr:Rnase Y domain-containing protein [Muribaculaceae bacterium]